VKLEDYVRRTEELLEKANDLLSTTTSYGYDEGMYVDRSGFTDFRTSCLSFLSRTFGENSPYFKEFDSKVTSNNPYDVERGVGILIASKEELEGGWLITTKGLLSAEIFSDFLEMAEHLLVAGYKDAAAIITGSVLEGHLRQLAERYGIDITFERSDRQVPKKADLLNAELAKVGVYNKLDQKNITALLDLRNKAAHGQYGEYTKSQVELMHQSVLDFVTRIQV
jgi:hypothetical protein